MSSPDALFKATLNRLAARLNKVLADAAENAAEISQALPDRLNKEWDIFHEEVIKEAERIDDELESQEGMNAKETVEQNETNQAQIQIKVDHLRAKVKNLNHHFESRS